MGPAVALALLLLASTHLEKNWVYWQWMVGVGLSLGAFCFSARNRLGKLNALAVFYTLLMSVVVFASPRLLVYQRTPESVFSMLFQNSIYAFACYASVAAFLALAPDCVFRWVLQAVPVYTIANAVMVLGEKLRVWKFAAGHFEPTAFVEYTGMNGCLMAVGVGTIILQDGWTSWTKWLATGTVVVAILMSGSSIGCGTAALVAGAVYAHGLRDSSRAIGWSLAVLSMLGLAGFLAAALTDNPFSSSRRFEAYRIFMGEWWDKGRITFGLGPGSFPSLNALIQQKHGFMVEKNVMYHWLWLHSDWLQCAFELGLVGLALYLCAGAQVLRRLWVDGSRDAARLFSMAVGFAAMAAINYPARYFPTAFLMAFVAVAAYRLSMAATRPSAPG